MSHSSKAQPPAHAKPASLVVASSQHQLRIDLYPTGSTNAAKRGSSVEPLNFTRLQKRRWLMNTRCSQVGRLYEPAWKKMDNRLAALRISAKVKAAISAAVKTQSFTRGLKRALKRAEIAVSKERRSDVVAVAVVVDDRPGWRFSAKTGEELFRWNLPEFIRI